MTTTQKARLLAGAAAVTVALTGPQAVAAQCDTSDENVLCDEDTSAGEVNDALGLVGGPSVTLEIEEGVTVSADGADIEPPSPPVTGLFAVANAGVVGSPFGSVDLLFQPPPGSAQAGSGFLFVNEGTWFGEIEAIVDLTAEVQAIGQQFGAIAIGSRYGNVAATVEGEIIDPDTSDDDAALILAAMLGDASVETLLGARIAGDVEVEAGGDASLANDGTILGDIDLQAGQATNDVETVVTRKQTTLSDGSVRTDEVTTTTSRFSITRGEAQLVNSATGVIVGDVAVLGSDGIRFENAGQISGEVTLNARAQDVFTRQVDLVRETRFAGGGQSVLITSPSAERRTTNIGGDIIAVVGPGGTILGGLEATTNAGSAIVDIAGQIGSYDEPAGLAITASGIEEIENHERDPDDNSSIEETEQRATGGIADLGLDATSRVFGDVSVSGLEGVTLDAAAAIDGDVELASLTVTNARSIGDTQSTSTMNGTDETVATRKTVFETNVVGAAIDAAIASGGRVAGDIAARSADGIALHVAGSALGDIDLFSQTFAQSDETIRTVITSRTPVPGEDERVVTVTQEDQTTRNVQVGGLVSGNYSGIIGAPEGDENARDVAVTQVGVGGSTAIIGGTINGSFEGKAENTPSEIVQSSRITQTSGGGLPTTRIGERSEETSITHVGAGSHVTLIGVVLGNGQSDGNVEVIAAKGSADLLIEGGRVGGAVGIGGGIGVDSLITEALREVSQDAAGGMHLRKQSSVASVVEIEAASGGSANLRLVGGSIAGDVAVIGVGTGSSTTGARVSVDAQSSIGGVLGISNGEEQDAGFLYTERTIDTRERGSDRMISRTLVETEEFTPNELSGNIVADIDGSVGGVQARSFLGDVTVTLGGASSGDIVLAAGAKVTNVSRTTTFSGDDPVGLEADATQTQDETQATQTFGGDATLTIASGPLGTAGDAAAPAIAQGNIRVTGAERSRLNIGAGSSVLTGGGVIAVGEVIPDFDGEDEEEAGSGEGNGEDGTATNTQTETDGSENETTSGDPEKGVETTREQTQVTRTLETSSGSSIAPNENFSDLSDTEATIVRTYIDGEVATSETMFTQTRRTNFAEFVNEGIVGSRQASVEIRVTGVGSAGNDALETATIRNTGAIFGDVTLNAIGTQGWGLAVSDNTGAEDTENRLTFVRNALTSAARITNSGLIDGSVAVQAGSGTFTNTGVMRGEVNFGASVPKAITLSFVQPEDDEESPFDEDEVPSLEQLRSLIDTELGPDLLQQSYLLEQDGLFTGTINTGQLGESGFGFLLPEGTRTALIDATIQLGNNSITLGRIMGETADPAGDGAPARLTSTTLALEGAGFLGAGFGQVPGHGVMGDYLLAPDFAPYLAIDPTLQDDPATLASGATVTGVERIVKTGAGTFTIVAAPSAPGTFAFDIGAFAIESGDVELGVAGTGPFALRGNVRNDAGLWLGRRVGAAGSGTAIEGVSFNIEGDFEQGAGGRLYVPINAAIGIGSANTAGTINVSGNASLDGTIVLINQLGVYFDGQAIDFLTVGGTFAAENPAIDPLRRSNFLDYRLTTSASGDSTSVGIEVVRIPYATAATNPNEVAVANAFQAALPALRDAGNIPAGSRLAALRDSVIALDFGGIDFSANLGVVGSSETFGSIQSLSPAGAFSPLGAGGLGDGTGSGGIAAALAPTRQSSPVRQTGSSVSGIGGGETRLTAWVMPSIGSQTLDGDRALGTSRVESDHFGVIGGLELTTLGKRRIGIGIGYDDLDATSTRLFAEADSILLGAYAAQQFGPVLASVQAAYAWTDWEVTRGPSNSAFSSTELRISGDIAYRLPVKKAALSPFVAFTLRNIDVDAFTETGGALPLNVAAREDTVLSPELGLRFDREEGQVRLFSSASYVFQGDVDTQVTANFTALPGATFSLQGNRPEDYVRLMAGVAVDAGFGDLVLRGNALVGSNREAYEFAGALRIPF